jgi:hypothetical protein
VSEDDRELSDREWRGDPYGSIVAHASSKDLAAELLGSYAPYDDKSGTWRVKLPPLLRFVELMPDTATASASIIRFQIDANEKLVSSEISTLSSQVELHWADASTEDDRKFWIAASYWKVVDQTSQEILAERYAYLIDPGLGSRTGGRKPWVVARSPSTSCPPLEPLHNQVFLRKFVRN